MSCIAQDFGTQVYFSADYKKACRDHAVKRNGSRKFVPPALAEWMAGAIFPTPCATGAGLPRGWTSPTVGAVSPQAFADLFPGCKVGLRFPVVVVAIALAGGKKNAGRAQHLFRRLRVGAGLARAMTSGSALKPLRQGWCTALCTPWAQTL